MPTQVSFRVGTKAQYDALQTKDDGCLYFLTDKNIIYKGTTIVTSRYLIGAIPAGSNPNNVPGVRLTDQATGSVYDIPRVSAINDILHDHRTLKFSETVITQNDDLLQAIGATIGTPGTGEVEAGTVFRVETKDPVLLNPVQGLGRNLIANNHDLVIAIYSINDGNVKLPSEEPVPWEENGQVFAVIPTDLADLVTAGSALTANAVVLGDGNKTVKTLAFAGANKVLRTNSSNNGVEWVTPETVENVVYWEAIAVS